MKPYACSLSAVQVFLTLSKHYCDVCFIRTKEGIFLGWGRENINQFRGPLWKTAYEQWQSAIHLPEESNMFCPFIVAAITYEAGELLMNDDELACETCTYRNRLFYHDQRGWYTDGLEETIAVCSTIHQPHSVLRDVPIPQWTSTISQKKYLETIHHVIDDIRSGEYYQLNFTYPFHAKRPENLSLPEYFARLFIRFSSPRAAYIPLQKTTLLSLSPETFVIIDGTTISTTPIKGTVDAKNITKEEATTWFLSNEKECAELSMITDLLRNDVSMVMRTGTLRVVAHHTVEPGPGVWHLTSSIEAERKTDMSLTETLFSLLPAGSISGCPKQRACTAIQEYEGNKRGFYTGILFVSDGHHRLESNVLIRTVVADDQQLSYGVGGGITARSNALHEWNETILKASPLFLHSTVDESIDVWIDGSRTDSNHPLCAFLDPSYPLSFGVFETMFLHHGTIEHREEHIARLKRSIRLLLLPDLPDDLIRQTIDAMHDIDGSYRMKIVWTGEHLVATRSPYSRPTSPVTLYPVCASRLFPTVKCLPYTIEWSAHQVALSMGADDAILVDADGYITECAYASLFWMDGATLCTSEDSRVLPGVMRGKMIQNALDAGQSVRFERITIEELRKKDRIFTASSLAGIREVACVMDR